MTGWNMPPGVSERDIPGNRPEDQAAEDLANDLYGLLTDAGLVAGRLMPADEYDKRVDKAVELLAEYCGRVYARGHGDGVSDESMARVMQGGEDQ